MKTCICFLFILLLPAFAAKKGDCSGFLTQAKKIFQKKPHIKAHFHSQTFQGKEKRCEEKLSYSPSHPTLVVARLTEYNSEAAAKRQYKESKAILTTPFGPKKDIRTNNDQKLIAAFKLRGICHTRFVYRRKNKVFNYSFLNYAPPCEIKKTPGFLKSIWQAGQSACEP